MKITDYALIFIAITLPFMLMSYINVALIIRTYQQEMYYQKVIDSAVEDSINQMKTVENEDILVDYGYSVGMDNKISVNAKVAVSTFFDSFYNNLNLYADKGTQSLVQYYVPAIAIIDYNGVYISSIESVLENGQTVKKHIIKPKRYFSYTYALDKDGNYYSVKNGKWVKENKINELSDDVIITDESIFVSIHNIEFTTDDRVFHTGKYKITQNNVPVYSGGRIVSMTTKVLWETLDTREFYITDKENNGRLFQGITITDKIKEDKAKQTILDNLKSIRREVLVDIVTEELTYAANKNNEFAREKGIQYNFSFTVDSNDEMYNYIKNVGMLALVQGIKVGNKYLNYKAYNISDLVLTHKYYLTSGSIKFASNLYHKTQECMEYIATKGNALALGRYSGVYAQNITFTKEMAASLGYNPCPVCNP